MANRWTSLLERDDVCDATSRIESGASQSDLASDACLGLKADWIKKRGLLWRVWYGFVNS